MLWSEMLQFLSGIEPAREFLLNALRKRETMKTRSVIEKRRQNGLAVLVGHQIDEHSRNIGERKEPFTTTPAFNPC
jgi:hypothetical protein